jgi:23S rRNA G2445 N2-methylase RlmL
VRFPIFATCAPGLEPALHAEAKALKLAKVERQVGGVYFEGSIDDVARANLWLRTAVRVLVRVARFAAADADELYARAKEVEWSRFVPAEGSVAVDAQSSESALDHTLFVAQRVKDAIADSFRERTGSRPSVDKDDPDLRVRAHLFRDRCTLSLDSSGEALHKRGWRRHQGRAPLAETLAAGVVLLSDWDRRAPLIDPCCGSGTIAIEAALIAADVAPGLVRERFGFERWLGHDPHTWHRMREEARSRVRVPRKLVLAASDSDPRAVEAARENAAAAGLAERIRLEVADARELAPRPGWNAWIVSNLPYGERVGARSDLGPLYRAISRALRERCSGYEVALLAPKDSLALGLDLDGARRFPIVNGGLECELVRARL